jgi:hypothetical protein
MEQEKSNSAQNQLNGKMSDRDPTSLDADGLEPNPSPPPKTFNIKKTITMAGITLGLIGVVVLVLWLIATFMPGKTLEDNFTIGDTEITKEKITQYEKSLQSYKNDMGVSLTEETESGLSLRQIAENDLVFGAGLEYYGKTKCNVALSNEELLKTLGYEKVEGFDPQALDPYVLRTKNRLLREKLADCLLVKKDVLEVMASVASPNYVFENMDKNEISEKFSSVKYYMENTIAPLLKSGTSREEIARQTDLYQTYSLDNPEVDNYWTSVDYSGGEYNKIVSNMPVTTLYWQPWQSINTCGNSTNANGEKTTCETEIIRNLKVGETSQVFASDDNLYRVVRVEAAGGGNYNSWDDFLESLKNEFGYNKLSYVSSTIKYFALVGLDFIFGTDYAGAYGSCSYCNTCVDIQFGFWVSNSAGDSIPFSGNSYGIYQSNAFCSNGAKETWNLAYNQYHNGGQVNCGRNLPQISIGHGWKAFTDWGGNNDSYHCPAISNWAAYSSKRDASHSISGWTTSYSPSLSINTSGAWMYIQCFYQPVNLEYSSPFNLTPSTTVNASEVGPNKTITWNHTVKETSGKDVKTDAYITPNTYGDSWLIGSKDTAVRPTASVYQYISTSTTKPSSYSPANASCIIPNGTYRVNAANSPTYALDVSNGQNKGNKTIIYNTKQNWKLSCGSDGLYTFVGADNSSQCLDIESNAHRNGRKVESWDCNNSAAQKWRIEKAGSNKYHIYSVGGYALDINSANFSSGTDVTLWEANGTAAQEWSFSGNPTPNSTTGLITSSSSTVKASQYIMNNKATTYTTTTADAGKYVCQFVRSSWTSRNNFTNIDSTPKCVHIVNNWSITPTTQIHIRGAAWGDSDITVRRGDVVDWAHRFVVAANTDAPTIQYGYVGSGKSTASNKTAWSDNVGIGGTSSANGGNTGTASSITIPANAANGDQYCRATVAKPQAYNNTSEITGTKLCATVYVPDWALSASSSVEVSPASSASPKQIDYRNGDTAKWTFGFYKSSGSRNDGDVKTGTFGYDDVRTTSTAPSSGNYHDFSSKITSINIGTYNSAAKPLTSTTTLTGNGSNHNNTDPNNLSRVGLSDVGQNICRRATFKPQSYSNSNGWGTSGWSCVRVISKWTVTPSTTINGKTGTINIQPAKTTNFAHSLTGNNHVLKDTSGKDVAVKGTVSQTGLPNNTDPLGSVNSLTASNTDGKYGNATGTNSFTIAQNGDEIGKTICQALTVDKQQWDNQKAKAGDVACAHIPYNYDILPSVVGTSELSQEAGQPIKVGMSLLVDPVQGTDPSAQYETKTLDGVTAQLICETNGVKNSGCPGWDSEQTKVTNSGYYKSDFSGSIGQEVNWTVPGKAVVGTKYCFTTRILDKATVVSGNNQGGKDSGQKCFQVVKGPNLQIHGGESWSGENCEGVVKAGGFKAKEPSDQVGVVSSSWSQYGLFALGGVDDGFGSGGWIKPLSSAITANGLTTLERSKLLKFASDPAGEYLKGSTGSHCITNYYNYYQKRVGASERSTSTDLPSVLSSLASGSGASTNPKRIAWIQGNTTIDASSVNLLAGQDTLIIADGNITIVNNVNIYAGTYNGGITTLPQLTVVAKGNIIIEPSVTRLDGIYVAGSTFYTCGDTSSIGENIPNGRFSLTGACASQLRVNGAIIAKATRFQRTAGSADIYDGLPAELVSYPATIWLQEYGYRRGLDSDMRVVFYREVAGRI